MLPAAQALCTGGDHMSEKDRAEALAGLLKKAHKAVFFGGAGVSTESGVKDYRSEDGIYNAVKEYGMPPEEILSRSFFEKDPATFYDFYYKYFLMQRPTPNKAHLALAELEKMGILSAVITQNIDGLHQAAGSENVYELHGTAASYHCTKCHKKYDKTVPEEARGGIPKCDCGGILKPDVVLYEEPLNQETLTGAIRAISEADLMIVGGTSLAVYPAAGLLMYYLGEDLVLINRTETPWDARASLIYRENIGEVLSKAVGFLKDEG